MCILRENNFEDHNYINKMQKFAKCAPGMCEWYILKTEHTLCRCADNTMLFN